MCISKKVSSVTGAAEDNICSCCYILSSHLWILWLRLQLFPRLQRSSSTHVSKGSKTKPNHIQYILPRLSGEDIVNLVQWIVSVVELMQPLEHGWPPGAVTSQALHTFTLQGQIPVTEPGDRDTRGPWQLVAWGGKSLFEWYDYIEGKSRGEVRMQTWSCPALRVILGMRRGVLCRRGSTERWGK